MPGVPPCGWPEAALSVKMFWPRGSRPGGLMKLDMASVPVGAGRVPFSHAIADLIAPFRPPLLSFHFGLPAPDLLARVKAWGAVVLSSATTVAEARWLAAHGADAIGSWLDASLDLAQEAHTIAEAMPDLEVFERPSTHMLLFRFTAVDLEQRDDVNDAIRETLFMEGRTVIARTRWGGETWLKLTLLNPMADAADLRATFDDVVRTGHLLAGDLNAEVSA